MTRRWAGRSCAAVLVLLVVTALVLVGRGPSAAGHEFSVTVLPGAVTWPFQGSQAVATAHQADAVKTFDAAAVGYVRRARATGRLTVHLGAPHALFAAHYGLRDLDIVVEVAPLLGVTGPAVGLAGFYVSDSSHHGVDAVMVLGAADQEVSGTVRSYVDDDMDEVTVVVGGPRAGGLLVSVTGGNAAIGQIDGNQTMFDSRGIAWIYPSIPPSEQHERNGVITVTDGNGDIEHALYVGRPAAVQTW